MGGGNEGGRCPRVEIHFRFWSLKMPQGYSRDGVSFPAEISLFSVANNMIHRLGKF